MTPREMTEQIERQTLAPWAAFSDKTGERAKQEEPCPIRTAYQRDRDRIIHSKAFRRLKSKTQVFLSPEGDHYRTRLTHTLEVSQIARTVARALRLNEDLTEAIALGHDLGHTPFGHAGERALNKLSPSGFKHYQQSVRVCEKLERDHRGLNLCPEVLNGFDRHTSGEWPATLEGCVVRYADRIAYVNHDIEDAITAGVLNEAALPHETRGLGRSKSQRITTLITSLIDTSADGRLYMAQEVQAQFDILHKFMYATVYVDPVAKAEENKVEHLIAGLYEHFMADPQRMPAFYLEILYREGPERAVTDYISGMSDDYAIHCFEEIYVPRKWARNST